MTPHSYVEGAAFLTAVIGTICLVIWPVFPGRRGMLFCQLTMALSFVLHYALAGVPTAAVLNGIGGLQLMAGLVWGDKRGGQWIGKSMIVAIVVATIISWSGLTSALSAAGMLFIAIGRMQIDPTRLRLLVLAGVPFWLAHDIVVGSPLAWADALSAAVGLWAVVAPHFKAMPKHSDFDQKLRPAISN